MPLQASNMVSGLSVVNLPQPHKFVYVLSVALKDVLTLLKTQSWLTATYQHNLLPEMG